MNILTLYFPTVLFFYLIIALITGITGIITLVIGISRRKVHVWVTSIILLLIAVVFGITSVFIGVRGLLNDPDILNKRKYSHHWFNDKGVNKEPREFTDDTPMEKYTSRAKAVMIDSEGFVERVEVLGKKRLARKGIILDDLIQDGNRAITEQNIVIVKLTFNRTFRGYLHLKAFDDSRKGIAMSSVEIDIHNDLDLKLEFTLDRDILSEEVDYFTLSSENF